MVLNLEVELISGPEIVISGPNETLIGILETFIWFRLGAEPIPKPWFHGGGAYLWARNTNTKQIKL